MTMTVEEFIEHHGVKGMHWGIRTKSGPKRTSSDYRSTVPHRGKRPSELTNKQLKLVNERMNLETKYSQLNPSTVKKGQTVAKAAMGTLVTGVTLYNLYHSPAGKAAIELGKRFIRR